MAAFEEDLDALLERHFPQGQSVPVEVLLLRRFVRAVMCRRIDRPVAYGPVPPQIRHLLSDAEPSELRGVLMDLLPRLAAKERRYHSAECCESQMAMQMPRMRTG